MGDYPILHLIVRYGAAGAVAVSVLVFAVVAGLGYHALGWLAIALAAVTAALVYIVAKSYAELVRIITEMLLPR
jgi:hypothetical protein